jgi:hypothetical protein
MIGTERRVSSNGSPLDLVTETTQDKGDTMLAIIAAVLFGISLVLQLVGLAFGPIGPELLNTAGLLCVALYLAGVGARSYSRSRR